MADIKVSEITEFNSSDLEDICLATEDSIREGIGFNWISPPSRDVLESYWRGVLVVPERTLFAGRLEGTLAASIQLIKPPPSKQTTKFNATLGYHFVAPWARGHGLAKALLQAAEEEAKNCGFSVISLNVRETQEAALKLYHESGYIRWGIMPYYEMVGEAMIAGHYFYKNIKPIMKIV
ncbi:MAG: GNAT family N-acetyltransferase [Pseudomonadota bacterium]